MVNESGENIVVGVVGLGVMGTSFIATLLMAKHRVIAVAPLSSDTESAPELVFEHLRACLKAGLLSDSISEYQKLLTITEDYNKLQPCDLVVECVIEVIDIKRSVYEKIENVVRRDTVIASNTSAIPISELQNFLEAPERFLGMHWAEPSYLTRFMEITVGKKTCPSFAEWVYKLTCNWNKEPTLLRKDIRGFITNRIMYAVYREGLSIVTNQEATLEDVDKAFRYDVGSWITLMGIFRRIDYLGLENYEEIFSKVFPILCNDINAPTLMLDIVAQDARGIRNLKGLYEYTEEESSQWDKAFALFNAEIYELAAQYPSNALSNPHLDSCKVGEGKKEVL